MRVFVNWLGDVGEFQKRVGALLLFARHLAHVLHSLLVRPINGFLENLDIVLHCFPGLPSSQFHQDCRLDTRIDQSCGPGVAQAMKREWDRRSVVNCQVTLE